MSMGRGGIFGYPDEEEWLRQFRRRTPVGWQDFDGGAVPEEIEQPTKKRGGLFGRNTGNTLANILGTIGDALMMREGMGPVYTPMRMQRREDEEKRRREEERAMQIAQAMRGLGKSDAEIQAVLAGVPDGMLPKPAEKPSFMKNYEAWSQLPDEQRQAIAKMQRDLNPPQMGPYTGWDGQRYGGDTGSDDGWVDIPSGVDPQEYIKRMRGAGSGQPGFR